MPTVITFGNMKGGVGKTTTAAMTAYALSDMGYNTLLVDLDAQGNATTLLLKTYEELHGQKANFNETLMMAIAHDDVGSIRINVKSNLDLLPSYRDFADFTEFLYERYPKDKLKRQSHLKRLFEGLKGHYDYILIDVPPTKSLVLDNALNMSDYAVLVMQSQERSFVGAELFIDELIKITENGNPNLDILGILPVILKKDSKIDQSVMERAKTKYTDLLFDVTIPHLERLKRYDVTGILKNDKDVHDKRVHALYAEVAKELIKRKDGLENE